jgi:predicted metal-dependent hydrolase
MHVTPHDQDRRNRTIAALLEARDALRAEKLHLARRREMAIECVTVTVALENVTAVLDRLIEVTESEVTDDDSKTAPLPRI